MLRPAFQRPMHDRYDVSAIASKICPVELENQEIVLLCLPDFVDDDQADEMEKELRERHRCKLHNPSRIVVSQPATLMAIVRAQITAESLRSRRQILTNPEKSGIYTAFIDLVRWGVVHNASDLHLNVKDRKATSEVRFTVGGKYITPERFRAMPTGTVLDILKIAYTTIHGSAGAVFDPTVEQQGRIFLDVDSTAVMLRWASLAADDGASVTLRLLRLEVDSNGKSFKDLGYLPSQIQMINRARLSEGGAVTLAGVVGSGKSTTLAAMMRMIPDYRKVITLEDPVEYIIPNAIQNTVTRRLGANGADNAFDAKLKTIKRSAMQDLMIGEIRDMETGRAFMDLASSGTNLYTTTHTGSAIQIPDRLASDVIGVSREFLATPGVLKLLVYQALLPKLCSCALPFEALVKEGGADHEGVVQAPAYWREYGERISKLYGFDALATLKIRNADGCPKCRRQNLPELNGFNDRTVVAEMLEPGVDEYALNCVRRADNVNFRRHFLEQRATEYTDPDMTGKTAMECAVYKAFVGDVDPRDIEPRFRSFETEEIARKALNSGRNRGGNA